MKIAKETEEGKEGIKGEGEENVIHEVDAEG